MAYTTAESLALTDHTSILSTQGTLWSGNLTIGSPGIRIASNNSPSPYGYGIYPGASVRGNSANQILDISVLAGATRWGSQGNIDLDGGSDLLQIYIGEGNGYALFSSTTNLGGGDDKAVIHGHISSSTIDAGEGNDLLSIKGAYKSFYGATVNLGAGNDEIYSRSRWDAWGLQNFESSVFTGGEGNDIFDILLGSGSIDGGLGADTYRLDTLGTRITGQDIRTGQASSVFTLSDGNTVELRRESVAGNWTIKHKGDVLTLVSIEKVIIDSVELHANSAVPQVSSPVVRGNSLYTIVDGPSWTQAEANSLKLGGHLASIQSDAENALIYSLLNNSRRETSNYWIGLYLDSTNWIWSDGLPMNYSNWRWNEPNGDGVYAHIRHYDQGSWNDITSPLGNYDSGLDFYDTTKGIAEIPFIRRGDSAYVIVQGSTWEEAEANAVKLGGHLVTINDAAEYDWIATSFGGRRDYDYRISAKELKTIFSQGKQSQILQIQWLLTVSEANGAKGTFQGSTPFDIVKSTKDDQEIISLFYQNTQYGNDYKDIGEVTSAEIVEWIIKHVDKDYAQHPMWDSIEEQLYASRVSDYYAEIKLAPNNTPTGTPTLSGNFKSGQVITIDKAPIQDADNFTGYTPDFKYSWESSTDGTTWTPLTSTDATDNNSTYTLTTAEVSKQIRGVMSYVDGYGTTETLNSNASTLIEAQVKQSVIRGESLYIFVDPLTWSDAENKANALGGHLITINSEEENEFAKSIAEVGFYIGYNRNSGSWSWSSGESEVFTKWRTQPEGGWAEPNNWRGIETVAMMMIGDQFSGYWNDIPDDGRDVYGAFGGKGLVEIPFIRRGDSAYVIVQGPTWEEAEANAVALGGHLVTINDDEENEWLVDNYKTYISKTSGGADFWIGYTDRDIEGTWRWLDGSSSNYSNWGGSGPNNRIGSYPTYDPIYTSAQYWLGAQAPSDPSGEDYVVFNGVHGMWNDAAKNHRDGSVGIAEITLAPNNSPTGTPTLTGNFKAGQVITIDKTPIQDADNFTSYTPDFKYTWEVSSNGTTWTPLTNPDATDENNTYTLTTAEVNRQIRGVVSYVDGYGSIEHVHSSSQSIEAAPATPSQIPPTIPNPYYKSPSYGLIIPSSNSRIWEGDPVNGFTGLIEGTTEDDIYAPIPYRVGPGHATAWGLQIKDLQGNSFVSSTSYPWIYGPNSSLRDSSLEFGDGYVRIDSSITQGNYGGNFANNKIIMGAGDSDINIYTGGDAYYAQWGFSADLVAGAGADALNVTMDGIGDWVWGLSGTIDMGDGDDKISSRVRDHYNTAYTAFAIEKANIKMGAGNDVVTAFSTRQAISESVIDLGEDNDNVELQGIILNTTINGGAGDDRIRIISPSSDFIVSKGSHQDWVVRSSLAQNSQTSTEWDDYTLYVSGIEYIEFDDIEVKLALNNAPTGSPQISGDLRVGAVLNIDASPIQDADNFTGYTPTYQYTWESSTDGSIWDALTTTDGTDENNTYTLTTAEVGKQIRGVVSYVDGYGMNESVTTLSASVPTSIAAQQISGPREIFTYRPGSKISIPLLYSTTDGESGLSGLTLNVHHDSTRLKLLGQGSGITEQIAANAITTSILIDDTGNLDSSLDSDKIIQLNWASLDNTFPGTDLAAHIATANFTTSSDAYDPITGAPLNTVINFTASETASNYGFEGTPVTLIPESFHLDIDGDGRTTALGDGLMVIRKLFGAAFAGDALTNKAASSNAAVDTQAMHHWLEAGIASGKLDVDRDGRTTALGDGLMVIRHMFGTAFAGDALIDKAMSNSSPYAGQSNAAELISQNIEALINVA